MRLLGDYKRANVIIANREINRVIAALGGFFSSNVISAHIIGWYMRSCGSGMISRHFGA